MSKIRSELCSNYTPGIEVRPDYTHNNYNALGIKKFNITMLKEIFERTKGIIEFGSSNSGIFDETEKIVGWLDSIKNPMTPDPKLHHQQCLSGIGRYTQNSQYFEKDPLFKTHNEVSFRCFVRDCEFTFDIIFTPTGKSATLIIFTAFEPNFSLNSYNECFDKRGLTKNVDELIDRIYELKHFAHTNYKP